MSLSRPRPTAVSRFYLGLFSLTAALLLATDVPSWSKSTPYPDSHLPLELQGQLVKAVKGFKQKKFAQATADVEVVAAGAQDTDSLLFIVSTLDGFGAPSVKAKRACLEKALSLAKTSDELLNIALKARQAECFDLSKAALDSLVAAATTFEDLIDLAHKAHQASQHEIAQTAIKKAYTLVNNVPDVFTFAKESMNVGLEAMARTALKDLVEDQASTSELMTLMPKIGAFNMIDVTRLALKRGLEKSKTVDDYLAVYNQAKRFEQEDIVKVAAYRGKKLTLINKIKDEKEGPMRARERELEEKERKAKEEMMRSSGQIPSGF